MNNYLKTTVITLITTLAFTSCSPKDPHEGHDMSQAGSKKVKPKFIGPMHPQITSDKPSKCPICGMDLIPISEYEKEYGDVSEDNQDLTEDGTTPMDMKEHNMPDDRSSVSLSKDKQQIIGVELGKVEKRQLFKEITAPGRVAFDPDLYTAQSEYLEALKQWGKVKNSPLEAAKKNTQEMIRSAKIRLKVLGLSSSQIAALAKKGSQSESLILSGGKESWIYADVFEQELANIESGLPVEISASFLQGKKLYGKVSSVDDAINPQTRTAKLRISVESKKTKLRPESFVNVSIFAPLGEMKAIPKSAVLNTGKETFVFVVGENNKFEPRNVTIVVEGNDYFGVGDELNVDDQIVLSANFMLDSESRLKAVIKNAGKASSPHSGH